MLPLDPAFAVPAVGLALVGAAGYARLRTRRVLPASPPRLPAPRVARELLLPVIDGDPDQNARASVLETLSVSAVAGDWAGLARQIAEWEGALDATPLGERYHDIAVDSCLLGLETLIDDAPRSDLDGLVQAEREVARFVERHRALPDDHILAALAARAHIAVGTACDTDHWPEDQHRDAWRRMARHFLAASGILERFDPLERMSPVLGEACYLLAEGLPDSAARIRPAFDDWIDLDPSSSRTYSRHVRNLTAERYGSDDELLTEADRAEDRTSDTLGAGGYALFWMPLLSDERRARLARADRLAVAIRDLALMSGTQAEVNWAAATLATEADRRGADERPPFQAAFDALALGALGMIYPALWDEPIDRIRQRLAEAYARAEGRKPEPPERIISRGGQIISRAA